MQSSEGELTRSGLREELEEVRRDLEDLEARIGDGTPTEDQLTRVRALEEKLESLEQQLRSRDRETEDRAEGDSFYARWLRFRRAFEDITEWDIADGKFRFEIGTRVQLDGTVPFGTDEELDEAFTGLTSSFKARRARIYAEGRLFRTIDFKFEYDLGADLGLKDAYLEGARYTKFFRWRLGNFKEPFSLARQNGSFDRPFLELPLPVAAIAPGSNFGLMFRHDEFARRMTWAVSATTSSRQTDDNKSNADLSLTTRLTGLPLDSRGGRRLLHLGAAYSLRNPSDNTLILSTHPEARFLPEMVSTGPLVADGDSQLFGLEAALVHGSFWAQAEWLDARPNVEGEGNLGFGGGYLQVGYLVTGEHRPYDRRAGAFERVRPTRKFAGGNVLRPRKVGGAIELSGRASLVDLDSGQIFGGRERNLAGALTWYATGAFGLSLNVIHAKVEDLGSTNIALIRFQFSP